MRIEQVWLEAEDWEPGEWIPADCNSDVGVTLSDGTTWIATFFTYQNIETLRKANAESGDCLGGAYFWATDIVLIDELTRERVTEVVNHLIAEGEFELIFAREDEEDEEEDGSA